MRKLLLSLFFIGCLTQLKAQSWVYHPLPSDSLVWLESYQDWEGIYHYYIKEMVGDTTIGSYTYKKLYQSAWWSTPFYTPPVPLGYIGAVRQDIPAKRVYRINTSGVEDLLYDFNKVPGDTFAILTAPMPDTLYIQSVDSVIVGTTYHKTFAITSSTGLGMPSDLIEGVGNRAGFGNYYDYGFEYGYQLLCFSHSNVQQYPIAGVMPGGPYCYISVGLIEVEKNNFKVEVMPNPTFDAFHLNINCKENYSIQITNESGQLMLQKDYQTSNELTFDVSSYPEGIYFIRLSDVKGNSAVKKIVKK